MTSGIFIGEIWSVWDMVIALVGGKVMGKERCQFLFGDYCWDKG